MDAFTSRKQDVLKVLKKVSRAKESAIDPETALSDLGVDSLGRVELLFELERLFDLEISDDHARAMRTVGDVLASVEARCTKKQV